ncbi:MAG: SH3 domain-containing protein [Leptospirales bacterium]|nr:SH3 domain-containing protein [Leptospirales bacterium]
MKNFNKIVFTLLLLLIAPDLFAKVENYIVWVDGLRLREAPSADAKVVASLKKYDELTSTGESKDDNYKAVLSDIEFTGGWIKVKTKQNLAGWLYEPALSGMIIKNGLKFYAVKTDLFVIQEKSGIVLKKIPIKAEKNVAFNQITISSTDRVNVIGVSQRFKPNFTYIVYNVKKNEASKQINYQNFCGFSKSDDYAMFDGGANDTPTLIYSLVNARSVHEFTPIKKEEWEGDSVKYDEAAGRQYAGRPDLPKGRVYVKSCVWNKLSVDVVEVYEKPE